MDLCSSSLFTILRFTHWRLWQHWERYEK